MKKNIEKVIKGLANQLPQTNYTTIESTKIKGEDVALTGLEVPEGMNIEDDKEYRFNSPVHHSANHARRLKRAYKKQGVKGVVEYALQFIKDEHQERVETNIKEVFASI